MRCSDTHLRAILQEKYGRQMLPMNPPGYTRSCHRWSVWRSRNSLGFAKNISKENWTYMILQMHWCRVSICTCALVKSESDCLLSAILIDFMIWADYWLTDHPEFRWTTQTSTIGCLLCDPEFCIFHSTVRPRNLVALCKFLSRTTCGPFY